MQADEQIANSQPKIHRTCDYSFCRVATHFIALVGNVTGDFIFDAKYSGGFFLSSCSTDNTGSVRRMLPSSL